MPILRAPKPGLISLAALVVVLAIGSAAIAVIAPFRASSSMAIQDEIAASPDKHAMEKFMARKLLAAQRALEGMAREDFERLRETTTEMIELSRHEVWERMASPRFVQDTMDFVAAAEFLNRMAEAKDAEGSALGFMRLTMTCTNCHSHVRTSSVAMLDGGQFRSGSNFVAKVPAP